MNLSSPFIPRPVGTTLLTIAVALAGIVAYSVLPVSPLPQVDFPTIRVQAKMPGASPETMASTIATPLERTLGRIAGIDEMTSSSSLGNTNITLQFDLDRDIDGAARDVQAAINAARAILPTMPSNPTYRKMNPADAPIMLLSLTSDSMTSADLYDLGSSVLSQKLSQIYGVGQVMAVGSSKPAVRVEISPDRMNSLGISLQEVRIALSRANANLPKGSLDNGATQWFVGANDQLMKAREFASVIIRDRDGVIVRLSDIAEVIDSVENTQNAAYANGKPAIMIIVFRQPGANIIETVARIKESLGLMRAWMPEGADLELVQDRSPTITASVHDVELTLVVSMFMVVLVVYLFLQDGRATFVPAVAVPVSLLGTFGVMHLAGFSLNHLSLMALTIATGFVVDDAIVVTENIVRHIEEGLSPFEAAIKGTKEVAFTVMSISLSLVAIFIPILFMGGLLGRLFKEFAISLSAAVLVSLVVSLVSTPMMCAHILRGREEQKAAEAKKRGPAGNLLKKIGHAWTWFLQAMHNGYARTLDVALKYKKITLLSLILTIVFNVYLYVVVPKGFFPRQDTGQIDGSIQADQSISFQAMNVKLKELMSVVQRHPAVQSMGGYTGGNERNSGRVFVTLKPQRERKKIQQVISELRRDLAHVPGATLYLTPTQDVRVGGRRSSSVYQYTLQSDNLQLLRDWTPRIAEAFRSIPGMIAVNTDAENNGLQTTLEVNRDTLARYNITFRQLDQSLGYAFAQSFASTIFTGSNQYRVVMEFEPQHLQGPEGLLSLYVASSSLDSITSSSSGRGGLSGLGGSAGAPSTESLADGNNLVPLTALATHRPTLTSLGVAHQAQFAAATISFDLEPGVSLSDMLVKVNQTMTRLGVPASIHGGFQGTAKAFADSMRDQPLLIFAALLTLYIVLGVLYESLIHPITILSTLPSAGVGAILALMAFGTEFSVIAFIGVLLLAGIVKKNAILMIDFAVEARRNEGLSAHEAIRKACLLRFRPIMMTTLAAMFGAIPLLLGIGEGAELRTPLGITIIGGLTVSQLLTLYTTPVVYLYLDRFTGQKNAPSALQRIAS